MPRPIGSPITVTNGQPQREVERFQVFVTYDNAGVPHYTVQAYTLVRLRAADGSIISQDQNIKQLVAYADAALPAPVRTVFGQVLAHLDTLPDPP